jgi:hypothetical protein
LDIFFNIAFAFLGLFVLLFFAVYWKPLLVFFVIMLTVYEPYVGVSAAFFGSFFVMIWLERANIDCELITTSLKFSFYLTVFAIALGLTVDFIFDGSSGGYGRCSRANPEGC